MPEQSVAILSGRWAVHQEGTSARPSQASIPEDREDQGDHKDHVDKDREDHEDHWDTTNPHAGDELPPEMTFHMKQLSILEDTHCER